MDISKRDLAEKIRSCGMKPTAQRIAILPDVPTVAESGVPGFEAVSWFGLYAPAGTPPEIVKKLNADVLNILAMPDVKEKFAEMGAFSTPMTPEAFSTYLGVEIAKYAKVIKDSGANVE